VPRSSIQGVASKRRPSFGDALMPKVLVQAGLSLHLQALGQGHAGFAEHR
jgi:hypothetical protein